MLQQMLILALAIGLLSWLAYMIWRLRSGHSLRPWRDWAEDRGLHFDNEIPSVSSPTSAPTIRGELDGISIELLGFYVSREKTPSDPHLDQLGATVQLRLICHLSQHLPGAVQVSTEGFHEGLKKEVELQPIDTLDNELANEPLILGAMVEVELDDPELDDLLLLRGASAIEFGAIFEDERVRPQLLELFVSYPQAELFHDRLEVLFVELPEPEALDAVLALALPLCNALQQVISEDPLHTAP